MYISYGFRFVARRRCLCAYFPRVYLLRIVAQWGRFGVVRIRQAMTYPVQKSIYHRQPNIRIHPKQAIHQTRIILPKKAEQIHHHPSPAYLKARREHRRACPQIRAQVHQASVLTRVHLRVPSKANRLEFN